MRTTRGAGLPGWLCPVILIFLSAFAHSSDVPIGSKPFVDHSHPPSYRLLDTAESTLAGLGQSVFEIQWAAAGTPGNTRTGVGPLFNATSYNDCHHDGARGSGPGTTIPMADDGLYECLTITWWACDAGRWRPTRSSNRDWRPHCLALDCSKPFPRTRSLAEQWNSRSPEIQAPRPGSGERVRGCSAASAGKALQFRSVTRRLTHLHVKWA